MDYARPRRISICWRTVRSLFLLAPGGEIEVEELEEVRSASRFGRDYYIYGLIDGVRAGLREEIYEV